jgi:hypothetical protein
MAKHPTSIVRLTMADNEMDAGIIIAALAAEGIKATMSGGATADFRVGVPGDVEILVTAEDLPRAQQILREAEEAEEADEMDDDNEDEADYDETDDEVDDDESDDDDE